VLNNIYFNNKFFSIHPELVKSNTAWTKDRARFQQVGDVVET